MDIRALEELEIKLHLLVEHLQSVKEENLRLRQSRNQPTPEIHEAVRKIQTSLRKISGWIDEELKAQAELNHERGE
ncbi:MAG: hypothetical protein DRP86_07935 [Candidatus Neomarinimicrobiota bacterium]|nr:hypothetical protein [Candidatus Neomarinimicrobiota bacterium]RKY47259.1 MAG: hypothetical protein DRP86_07935 [Candidatus Neomarinimicrobiota bacterium]